MIKKISIFFTIMMLGTAMACSATSVCAKAASMKDVNEINEMDKTSTEEDDRQCLSIGSVSKVYTVTAVMQLVDLGKVDLDAPVTDYIPEFEMADERYKDITVKMLMNHTSGLMGSSYGAGFLFDDKREDYHDEFLSRLRTQRLKYEPGEFNCYCNDGFTLLEILVERVSGMTFTEYMEEKICEPLSLENTGSVWNMGLETQVPIYVNGNTKLAHESVLPIGAGGILSDAKDVCIFGSSFFKGNDLLLSEQAKQEMAKDNRTGYSVDNFGLGWDTVGKTDYEKAGVTVLSKGGDTFYQNSSLVVAPNEKISVAVLSSGGGSSVDEEVCLELMDIALAEQGITVEHPEEEKAELLDVVPEEYLSYEGLYADARMTVGVSFPDNNYMQITSVTSERDFEEQYMYTENGTFVKMNGDVASGNAIPTNPKEEISFVEYDGQVYIFNKDMGCILYKTEPAKVDDKVQEAWDKRDGVTYYLVSGPASDESFANSNNSISLHTNAEAKGFVNGYVMQDEDHARIETVLPGNASRDSADLRIETADGKEYLRADELNWRYISEECIPTFTEDIKTVDLKTNEACWYKIDGAKDVTLRLTIPEKAAVYVFDRYGNMRYSSYMTGYGTSIPLTEYGMIVFIGEDGLTVNIER